MIPSSQYSLSEPLFLPFSNDCLPNLLFCGSLTNSGMTSQSSYAIRGVQVRGYLLMQPGELHSGTIVGVGAKNQSWFSVNKDPLH